MAETVERNADGGCRRKPAADAVKLLPSATNTCFAQRNRHGQGDGATVSHVKRATRVLVVANSVGGIYEAIQTFISGIIAVTFNVAEFSAADMTSIYFVSATVFFYSSRHRLTLRTHLQSDGFRNQDKRIQRCKFHIIHVFYPCFRVMTTR